MSLSVFFSQQNYYEKLNDSTKIKIIFIGFNDINITLFFKKNLTYSRLLCPFLVFRGW